MLLKNRFLPARRLSSPNGWGTFCVIYMGWGKVPTIRKYSLCSELIFICTATRTTKTMPSELPLQLTHPLFSLAESTSTKPKHVVQDSKDHNRDLDRLLARFKLYGNDPKSIVTECDNLLDSVVSYGFASLFSDIKFYLVIRSHIFEQAYKQPAIAYFILRSCNNNETIIDPIVKFLVSEFQLTIQKLTQPDIHSCSEIGPWTEIKLLIRFTSLLSPIISLQNILYIYRTTLSLIKVVFAHVEQSSDWYQNTIFTNTLFLFFFDRKNRILLYEILSFLVSVPNSSEDDESFVDLLEVFCFQNRTQHSSSFSIKEVKGILYRGLSEISKIFPVWSQEITFPATVKYTDEIKLELPTLEEVRKSYKKDHNFSTVDRVWQGYNNDIAGDDDAATLVSEVPAEECKEFTDYIVRDDTINLVQSMEFNKKEAASHLFNMSQYAMIETEPEEGPQMNEKPAHTEKTQLLREVPIKEIVHLLFKLPLSIHPRIYYETLLLEICKCSPKVTAPTFGRYFRHFYQNLSYLDYESTIIYEEWFRVQLTNFGFTWKWDEWIGDAERFREQIYHPKRMFQINLLKRLSSCTSNTHDLRTKLPFVFHDHLDSRYFGPTSMTRYLDVQFRMDKNACNIYDSGLLYLQACFPFNGDVYQILAYMQDRENDKEEHGNERQLGRMVDNIQMSHYGFFRDFEAFKIVLLIQCVCHCGKRSLSHVINYINRMENRLLDICEKSPIKQNYKEFIILDSILRYFNNNSRTGFIIVNSFKHIGFVSDSIILEFLFVEIDNGVRVITSYDARQYLLTMLEEHISLPKPEGHLFVKAYRLALLVVKQALDELQVSKDTTLKIKECKGARDDKTYDEINSLNKLNTLWKYFESLKLIKCLLRKFFVVYKHLSQILLGLIRKICFVHDQTINTITNWVEECNNLN